MSEYYEKLLKNGVPERLPRGPIDFSAVFDEYAASIQKTWSHDRGQSVGASECFSCIRKTFFSKRGEELGFKKDPFYTESWGATKRGDLIENHLVVPAVMAGLARRGMSLELAGEDQDTIVHGNSSATLDGLVVNAARDALKQYGVKDIKSDCFVLEMKSFDPRMNINEEKAVHRGQSIMQMGLIRDTTDYKPEYAVILYVQASFLDDIRPFVVPWDEEVYKIGRDRNDKVFNENDPAKFGPEGKLVGLCDYCPFTQACAKVSTDRVPAKRKTLSAKEVEEQSADLVDALHDLVFERAELSKQKKDNEARLEEITEKIKQILIDHDASRVVGAGWKVTYSHISGRSIISKEKMLEDGIDPDLYTVEGAGFEKLTITTPS